VIEVRADGARRKLRFSAICATVMPRASWMKNVVPGVVGVSSAKAKLDDAAPRTIGEFEGERIGGPHLAADNESTLLELTY
jgi:hypothetical protein